MFKKFFVLTSIVFLALATIAHAETKAPLIELFPVVETSDVEDVTGFSGSVTVDVADKYYFRGALQEDTGFIVQPGIDLNWGVATDAGLITLNFGTWHSLHDEKTGSTKPDYDVWYEGEYVAGVSITPENLKVITAGVAYRIDTSPNDAFVTYEEIQISVTFDDSGLWKTEGNKLGFLGLKPSATLVIEIDGAADGMDEGLFLELGLSPSIAIANIGKTTVDVTVPVVVGISLDDYYEAPAGSDNGVAYVEVGVEVGVNLTDNIRIAAGPSFLWLTDDNLEALNSGDDSEIIGKAGITISF